MKVFIYLVNEEEASEAIGKVLLVVLVLEIVEIVPMAILHESVILRVLCLLLYFLLDLNHTLAIHHGV